MDNLICDICHRDSSLKGSNGKRRVNRYRCANTNGCDFDYGYKKYSNRHIALLKAMKQKIRKDTYMNKWNSISNNELKVIYIIRKHTFKKLYEYIHRIHNI